MTTASTTSRTRRNTTASIERAIASPDVKVPPQATTLLAEVMARLHNVELPIVQFIAACPASEGSRVAHDFAAACVAQSLRTLLLSSHLPPDGHALAKRRSASRASANQPGVVVPDAGLPGLFHRRIESGIFNASAFAVPANRSDSKAFRMVVMASPAPNVSPATLAYAAGCHGSILTVAAGVTRLPVLLATLRQVRHAGGTILGTVLFEAPRVYNAITGSRRP